MKATIVIVLLIVGALLRPQAAPSSDLSVNGAGPVVTNSGALSTVEMTQAVGGDMWTCITYQENDGDIIYICCLDLWLFEICAGVNWSAVQRLLPFL